MVDLTVWYHLMEVLANFNSILLSCFTPPHCFLASFEDVFVNYYKNN